MTETKREQNADKKKETRIWLYRGILVCLAAALIYTALYGLFRSRVERMTQKSLDTVENVGWLYQNTYVLYRELYNRENQIQTDYLDLYVTQNDRWLDIYTNEMLSDAFENMEGNFAVLNDAYGYIIRSSKTDCYVTNMSERELANLSDNSYFLLSFVFDSAGYMSVGEDIRGKDTAALRKAAMRAPKESLHLETDAEIVLMSPVDCTVTYAVSKEDWENNNALMYDVTFHDASLGLGGELYYYSAYRFGYDSGFLYQLAGALDYLILCMSVVFGLSLLLPLGNGRPWLEKRWCSLPLGILVAAGCILLGFSSVMLDMVVPVAGGQAASALASFLGHPYYSNLAQIPVLGANIIALMAFFMCAWYLGISLRAIRGLGLRRYLRERTLIWRFFRFIKRKLLKIYRYFVHVDLTENSLNTIKKVVVINAMILTVISVTWLGGLGIVIVYSIVLYFLLKKYFGDLQKRYGILLKAVDEMAEGNLNVSIEEDLGVFEPLKPQIIKIQSGFKKAVDEEVKSQRMKAELITNVSHDLKTPLTAIITYVNLLKDSGLTEEQRTDYLDTLERKSLRLKALIEDLFEFSKANSKNATLNLMPVDIMNLVKQVSYEMQDKLDEAELDIRMNLMDEKITLTLDSQKTYRIYENLFSNVAKYALRGTRVYINGFRIDDTVVITIKNISAQELTVDATELMERFVRGDQSRNTEGSGLGLAIAKSFAELQGGRLELEADGDLFKATTVWKV